MCIDSYGICSARYVNNVRSRYIFFSFTYTLRQRQQTLYRVQKKKNKSTKGTHIHIKAKKNAPFGIKGGIPNSFVNISNRSTCCMYILNTLRTRSVYKVKNKKKKMFEMKHTKKNKITFVLNAMVSHDPFEIAHIHTTHSDSGTMLTTYTTAKMLQNRIIK